MGAANRDGALMKPRKPKQTAKTSLVDKLLGKKGPVVFTRGEVKQLQVAFEDVTQTNLKLDRMVRGMALAIYRKRLQVIHHEHDDGSVSFDLENAPATQADAPEPMN